MIKTYKLVTLVLIACFILGGYYYFNSINKRNFVEKKQLVELIFPNVTVAEQGCLISKISLDFFKKIGTVKPELLVNDKIYTNEMNLMKECLLHKATQL